MVSQGGISAAHPARLRRGSGRAEGGSVSESLAGQIVYAFLNDQQMFAAAAFYRNTFRPPVFLDFKGEKKALRQIKYNRVEIITQAGLLSEKKKPLLASP